MKRDRFETVVSKCSQKLFNYLLRMVRSREDAEDLLQEVFAAFYQKMPKVDEEYYESYLYRAAHNKALNLIKKRGRSTELEMPELLPSSEKVFDPEQEMRDKKNALVRTAIRRLNEREASALNLQYYENKSYQEIAEIMDSTVSAIDSLLIRAKRKLKKYLSQDFATGDVLMGDGRND